MSTYRLEKLPLAVGVHYTAEFRNYKEKIRLGLSNYETDFGTPSVVLFGGAMSALFEKVIPLDKWPQNEQDALLDLVIVPRIQSAAAIGKPEPYIRYIVALYGSSGAEISTLEVEGHGWSKTYLSDYSVPDAILNAMGQLVVRLSSDPWIVARVSPGHARTASQPRPQGTAEGKAASGVSVMVLGPETRDDRQKRDNLENCLESAFKANVGKGTSVVPAKEVRGRLFPWLERGVAPFDEEGFKRVIANPLITSGLGQLGVRYLALASMVTKGQMGGPFACGGSAMGAGCFGASSGEYESALTVTLWDLTASAAVAAPLVAQAKGTSWIVGFIFPIWHSAETASKVCAEAAASISRLLQ